MVNAANNEDWTRYSEIEGAWKEVLTEASKSHAEMFNSITPALLDDIAEIQEALKRSQKSLYGNVKDLVQSRKSIKKYLE